MTISSFTLQKEHLSGFCCCFIYSWPFVCTKTYRSVDYAPKKCFNCLVQSAVGPRRQGDENSNSSVVAETMKFLAKSFYGYQVMDWSRHTVTKYLSDKETHATINSNLLKNLDHVNNLLYEVELAKAQIEQKRPIIVGLFIPEYDEKNCEWWSCTTTSSPNSVMYTSSKTWKETQIRCILLLPRKNWKTVLDLK